MLNFEINITKKVEITKLINGSIGNNWTFHWYACRDKDCSENDHSFYMVDGLFVDTNQEVWTHNPFAEYKFLEINPPNEPFYIWVAVNKNDGSEICFYFAEIRIFGSPCNDKIKLELLNCLEPGIENEEIIGKLCTTRTNLKAIQLNVSNNSVISFNREDENNRNSVIVNLSNIPTITDGCCSNYPLCYQFQVKINTTENGGYGRIEFTLIDDEDKEIEGCFPIYEFFIDPIFIPQIECRSNINELLCHNTNLPVCRCVNDVRIDRDDYFISSTF